MSTEQEEIEAVCKELSKRGVLDLDWSADPVGIENPWAEGWADVYLEEICEPLDLNWLITVVDPKDKSSNYEGHLAVKKDSALIFEFEDDRVAATKKFFLNSNQLLKEIPLSNSDLDEDLEENDFYWSLYKRPEYLYKENIYIIPVWSVEKIEEAIADWLKKISGVEFKLSFNPDKPSPIRAEVMEEIEAIKNNNAKTFDLGDGVIASENVFDAFLNDPEMANDVLKEIKKNLK
jgi:hypothetical protein